MVKHIRQRAWFGFTWVHIAWLALWVLAAGCGHREEPPATGATSLQGKRLFDRICAICHGREAEGVPGLGKGLRGNEFTRTRTDADLVEFLKIGRSASDPLNTTGINMPPKGGDPTLEEQDLRDIVAYLRTL